MPRTKLVMKLIENPRKRRATYKNRREGLVQKVSELATLCDIDAFLICFGPTEGVTTWPPEHDTVRDRIRRYQALNAQNKTMQNVNTSSLLQEEIAKQERRLLKVTQCGADDVLTPWDRRLDDQTEMELRDLLAMIDQTLQRTQHRIAVLGGQSLCNAAPTMPAPVQPSSEITMPEPSDPYQVQHLYNLLDGSDMSMAANAYMVPSRLAGQYYYDGGMPPAAVPLYLTCQMPSPSMVLLDGGNGWAAGLDEPQVAGGYGLDHDRSGSWPSGSLDAMDAATFQVQNNMATDMSWQFPWRDLLHK